jgi:Restriction endonuclease
MWSASNSTFCERSTRPGRGWASHVPTRSITAAPAHQSNRGSLDRRPRIHSGAVARIQLSGRGDLGADVIGVDPQGQRVVVQCKRYFGQPVTSGDMHRFLGTVWAEHRADTGVFVTTSRFTPAALALGRRNGLHMLDRGALAVRIADGGLPEPVDGTPDAEV